MQNKEYQRPLLPVVFSVIAGLSLGLFFPGGSIFSIAILSVLLIIIGFHILKKKRFKFLPIIFFTAIGYLLIQPYVDQKHDKDHITAYTDGTKYDISGIIGSQPFKQNRRYRFILKTESVTGRDSTRRPANGNISVSAYGESFLLKKGDRITFKSRIRRFRNFKNPGAFDYDRFMSFKDVWASVYVSVEKIKVNHLASSSFVMRAQSFILKLITENVDDDDVKSVLLALLAGNKNYIHPELREAFNRTGTGHLLAISGLHTGIVAVFSFGLFCFVLSFSHRLLWSGKILSIAGLLTLFPVIGYGAVAGMAPSTQRAVIMVSVLLLSYSFNTEYDLVNTLAFAALIILAVSPVSLFSVSFQLSFSAVCAIAAGVIMLNSNSEGEEHNTAGFDRFKSKLKSYLLISLLAWAGTLPIVSYYFNQIAIIGFPANIVMVPIVGFFVVPSGLLAVSVASISQTAGGILIQLTGYVLGKALCLNQYLADLPWSSMKVVTPSVIEIICCYSIFILSVFVYFKKKKGEKINRHFVLVTYSIVFLLMFVEVSFVVHKRFFHNSFRVTVIDVGQGSAALLELPDGKTMLIDGGGFNDNRSFDVGEKIIAPFLWGKRIRTVDTIVLTHPESDHLNGLLYVLEHFNVKTVWSNGQERELWGYKTFLNTISEKKIEHLPFEKLKRNRVLGDVSFEILYPFDDFSDKRQEDKWRNSNNNSLVLRAEYQGASFLFPGDIMRKAEDELVEAVGDGLKSTVLIVPHHGSKTSSGPEFLRAAHPDYAVISAGWKNRFYMPHVEVLDRLKMRDIKAYRTDLDGAVEMCVKDKKLRINTAAD